MRFATSAAADGSASPVHTGGTVTGVARMRAMVVAAMAGAAAIVMPGVVAALVLGRVRRRERSVLEQTRLDPVTGVLNRRGLEHELSEWSERGRGAEPVCLVSIHLDSFDEAASAWGGAAADQVMARVAVALERAYHRSHLVSRFVDHEFIVVSDIDPDLLVRQVDRSPVDPHRTGHEGRHRPRRLPARLAPAHPAGAA